MAADAKVVIVSATRKSAADFQSKTALGVSLARLAYDARLQVLVAMSNARGLPQVYNDIMAQCDNDSTIVFMHDDVWIDDYYMIQRVVDGLQHFDVIGLVGNRRRVPNQAAWCFLNADLQWDDPRYLSGAIGHGANPGGEVQYYGEAGVPCELLDGVFLAARKSTLVDKEVSFDPRFEFHFYDVDFCRTARLRGLALGTWPICVTHQGAGIFGTPDWHRSYAAYLEKWGG
jgi:GT2 family glycosyltransferase